MTRTSLPLVGLIAVVAVILTGCPFFGGLGGDTQSPARVSGLEGEPGNGRIVLSWIDPVDGDFDHVEITWQPEGGAIQSVASGSQSFTATGLTNGTAYTFFVTSVDTTGNKSTAATVTATPVAPTVALADVANLQATPGDGQVTLTWDDPADSEFDRVEIMWTPNGSTPQTVQPGVETYTATGLVNDTPYTFTVQTAAGTEAFSPGEQISATPTGGTVTDTTPPGEVGYLDAVAGDGQVTLSWGEPTDNDFDHVEITWTPGGPAVQTIPKGTTVFTASALTNDTLYVFVVQTVDTTGNASDGVQASATPNATAPPDTTPPGEVDNLGATAGDRQVLLTWAEPNDGDFSHVEITWDPDGSTVQVVQAGSTQYTAVNLANDTQYTFLVKTVDTTGNTSTGVSISATPTAGTQPDTTPPAEVGEFTATPGDTIVGLSWTEPGDVDFDHVEITWVPDGSTVQEVSAGTTTYQATGLVNGTLYTFTIRTVDVTGNVSEGVSAEATPQGLVPSDAIHVSKTGDDTTGDGSQSAPFATIQKGIDAALAAAKPEVHVQEGLYEVSTPVVMKEGVSVLGGYAVFTWERDVVAYETTIRDVGTPGGVWSSPSRAVEAQSNVTTATVIEGFTIRGSEVSGNFTAAVASSYGLTVENNVLWGGAGTEGSYGILPGGGAIDGPIVNNRSIHGGLSAGSSYGIYAYFYSGEISGNTIMGGAGGGSSYGIQTSYGSAPTIFNNVIDAGLAMSTTFGMDIFDSGGAAPKVHNNTIISGDAPIATYGILMRSDGDPESTVSPDIRNNIIYNISGSGSAYAVWENNTTANPTIFTNNNLAGYSNLYYDENTMVLTQISAVNSLTDMTTFGNVDAEPMFVNVTTKDFHLTAASPVEVREGAEDLADSFTTDKDGVLRTAPWSMGAYEY